MGHGVGGLTAVSKRGRSVPSQEAGRPDVCHLLCGSAHRSVLAPPGLLSLFCWGPVPAAHLLNPASIAPVIPERDGGHRAP